MKGKSLRGVLRWVLLGFAALLFAMGLVALWVANRVDNPTELVKFATAVVPTAAVAGASIFAVQTWADARASALDEKARQAIENLAVASTLVVGGTLNLRDHELPMRASIATWGSSELLAKLSERTMLIDSFANQAGAEIHRVRMESGDPEATVTVHLGERMSHVALITAEMLAVARKDLGLPKTSAKLIYTAIWGTVEDMDYEGALQSKKQGVESEIHVGLARSMKLDRNG